MCRRKNRYGINSSPALIWHSQPIGWECHIRAGEELMPVSDGHSLMGRGYFILEGEEGELRDKVRRVKALFRLA